MENINLCCKEPTEEKVYAGIHQGFENIDKYITKLNERLYKVLGILDYEAGGDIKFQEAPQNISEIERNNLSQNIGHLTRMLDDTEVLLGFIENSLGMP